MAQIKVSNLTFAYEGSFDNVFEDVSFSIDTNWKLGFIGRNGKGKTTFLNLLLGKYDYSGSISSNVRFDYFPYKVDEKELEKNAEELIEIWKSEIEMWQVFIELSEIKMDAECLYRPFKTLSQGERTRVMLAVLFAGENEFLLIDEPTNHLDVNAREVVKEYLAKKKGFILVSHDRDLLDHVCDHVLVLNRESIQVLNGNFSSWYENKTKQDSFVKSENEKHLKEIGKIKAAADRSSRWAIKNENTKIGFDPAKEHDRSLSTRSFIAAKTKKIQSRVKNYEKRIDKEIKDKEGLLVDIEDVIDLKLNPLKFHKEVLVNAYEFGLSYKDADQKLFNDLRFQIKRGDRLVLSGANGCGKSSIIKLILGMNKYEFDSLDDNGLSHSNLIDVSLMEYSGTFEVASGLTISYISQDTSFLKGSLKDFCLKRGLDETIFLSVLRQLDFERIQFVKNMEDYSEGQKKKVLIAASLITPAHLYIWDEPLNYIDVFSRMQIEKLILKFEPTMLIVEHDVRFKESVATKEIIIK